MASWLFCNGATPDIFTGTGFLHGWPGHKMQFLCNRLNHARCDRRGLFSIRTKCGLLNRLPRKVMGF
jgi:hypothetical protein